MPVVARLRSPMVASGSEIGEPAQNSYQPIQNVSLVPSPMMS